MRDLSTSVRKKTRDLIIIALIYILAYGVGYAASLIAKPILLRQFLFDVAATVVTFVFSVALRNSSVYDIYWSLTPMVLSVWLFVESGAFSVWQLIFLAVFNLWSLRLSINWITVFTDFSYEDWRYRKFREENGPFLWFIINFFGIHMVPTLVVFAGMLPLYENAKQPMNALCLFGIAVMLFGIAMEFFADRQMHAFLHGGEHGDVCKNGLWKYSRHPNYLGEISVWAGVFLTMLPFAPEKWYAAIGMVSVMVLFNAVSIPMMEKRQLSRRPAYRAYRKETSRLLLLPSRK